MHLWCLIVCMFSVAYCGNSLLIKKVNLNFVLYRTHHHNIDPTSCTLPFCPFFCCIHLPLLYATPPCMPHLHPRHTPPTCHLSTDSDSSGDESEKSHSHTRSSTLALAGTYSLPPEDYEIDKKFEMVKN